MSTELNSWWTAQFGIPDFDAYKAATHPFWDAVFPVDPFGALEDGAARTTATFPFSALGIAAGGYLTAHPYQSTDQSTGAGASVNYNVLAGQQAHQENSMAQLIIPGAFQVSIQAVCNGQAVENVIGVVNNGGSAAGAAAAVQSAWKVASGPLSLQTTSYTLTEFRAVDLSSSNGDIAVIADSSAGARGGGVSTNGVCALVQWNGGTRSRSSRGRLYFGPLQESDINSDGRTVATASKTLLNTAITNMRTSLASSGYNLNVLSRVLSVAFPVTSHVVENIIASQRRRIR